MAERHINEAELLDALRSSVPADALDRPLGGAVVVACDTGDPTLDVDTVRAAITTVPCILIGVDAPAAHADLYDVIVDQSDGMLDAVLSTVAANPIAASTLAVLLRGSEGRPVGEGLAAESAAYSTLQAGPEFAAWRAGTPVTPRHGEDGPAVRTERSGSRLLVALSRPAVHNAFSARMRDELIDALGLAAADSSNTEVVLTGDGPSFCSGGDLDEFGSRPDPATAHMVRLARSAGRVLASMSDRVRVHLHGACMGSGIELPAFASRVTARPDTVIALPEVGMGLIPGAGGTVSLPRRIGRHRTARLGLSCAPIDAETALEWGLVDEVVA